MGLSAISNIPSSEEMMRMSNHLGYGSFIDHNAWTGEQTLGALGLGDDTVAGLSDMNNGGDWAPAINQLAAGITSIVAANKSKSSKNKKSKAAPEQHQMAQHNPTQMSTEHEESGMFGMSTKTMIMIGVGALALIGLIIFMSKKGKRGENHDDHK